MRQSNEKLILFITSIITVFTLTGCSSSSSKNKLEEVKSKGKNSFRCHLTTQHVNFLTTENGNKKVVGDKYLAEQIAVRCRSRTKKWDLIHYQRH